MWECIKVEQKIPFCQVVKFMGYHGQIYPYLQSQLMKLCIVIFFLKGQKRGQLPVLGKPTHMSIWYGHLYLSTATLVCYHQPRVGKVGGVGV